MNIRQRQEHNYTGHSSYSNVTRTVISGVDPDSCPSGHSSCVLSSYSTTSVTSTESVSNTTKTTTRATPMNMRSKAHSHNYKKVSVSIGSKSATWHKLSTSTCPSGHSKCIGTYTARSRSWYRITSRSFSTVTTAEWKPSAGFNIRKKISHTHSLSNTKIDIDTAWYPTKFSRSTCGSGHSNCVMGQSGNYMCTSISTSGVTSSSALE